MPRGKMKLLDPSTGLMECRLCGHRHVANIRENSGGHYYRGSRQCRECRSAEPERDHPSRHE